jgi:hypothetical protein
MACYRDSFTFTFYFKIYLDLWNLPNCIRSIDGKHVRIKCFPDTGSLYCKYKGYFSIIVLACADADVGEFGKNSNSSAFMAFILGEMVKKEKLHIPFQTSLPPDESGETFLQYIIADETFPLKINLTRPYPRRMLTTKHVI